MEKYIKPENNNHVARGGEKTRMKHLSKNILVCLIALLLMTTLANAQTTTQNQITITSDKDNYFCEPIISSEGCLIKSWITIESDRNQDILLEFSPEYNTTTKNKKIEITQEITKEKADPTKTKTKTDKLAKIKYSKGDLRLHLLEFYTKKDGKFNITINAYDPNNPNTLLFKTVLDPFYNTSINASVPTLLLINGTNMNTPDNQYQVSVDITAGLIDQNPATNYRTLISQPYDEITQIIDGFSFNEITFNGVLHSITGNNNGKIIGELQSQNVGDFYSARFDTVDDRVEINSQNFQVGTSDFTYCAIINTTSSYGNLRKFIDLGEASGGDGFSMGQQIDGDMECRWDGAGGQISTSTTTPMNDGTIHQVCCRKINNTYTAWIDGIQEDTFTSSLGAINNTAYNISLNIDYDANQRWGGDFEQLGFARQGISDALLLSSGTSKQLSNMSKGVAISVFFNHSTEPSIETYYLYVKTNMTTRQTYRVMAYLNSTHINSSKYHDHVADAQEEFIPINSLLTENQTAHLRIYNLLGDTQGSIEELLLYETINDSIIPNITNPTLEPTNGIGCIDTAYFSAFVSDDQEIDQVLLTHTLPDNTFDINEMTRNGSTNQYTYFEAFFGVFNETRTLNFTLVNATDLSGNQALLTPNLSINYICITACVENWQPDPAVCSIYDNYTKTYTDANACNTTDTLPIDNGTTQTCDYCTNNITATYGTCTINNTRNVTYFDQNYLACCAVTGELMDCLIDYSPYNETQYQACEYFTKDFNCTIDTTPVLNDKINVQCILPTNEERDCLVNIYQLKDDGSKSFLASNPEYHEPTNSLLPLWQKETETRTSFTTTGTLLNAYYTTKELRPSANYEVEVVCVDQNATLKYEEPINPNYHTPDDPINWIVWVGDNAGYVLLILLLSTGALILIIYAIRKGRGK